MTNIELTKERIERIKAGTAGSMIVASNDTIAALCDLALAGLETQAAVAREAIPVTDAMVEKASRAYHIQDRIGFVCPPWESLDPEVKQLIRAKVRAAIEAALGAIDVAPAPAPWRVDAHRDRDLIETVHRTGQRIFTGEIGTEQEPAAAPRPRDQSAGS